MIRPGRLNELYSLRNVVSPILLVLKRTFHTFVPICRGGGSNCKFWEKQDESSADIRYNSNQGTMYYWTHGNECSIILENFNFGPNLTF